MRYNCGNCHGTGDDGLGLMPDSALCDACDGRGYVFLNPNAERVVFIPDHLDDACKEIEKGVPESGELSDVCYCGDLEDAHNFNTGHSFKAMRYP